MSKQPLVLKPHDVCVALQLSMSPDVSFRELAFAVGLSLGEVHNATKRLRAAGLVSERRKSVNRPALLEFLSFGVRYAFPGELGPETKGVPTAHSGPPLAARVPSSNPIVWPSRLGNVRGAALVPLCAGAHVMDRNNPELYELLTLVDALRVGRAREREIALEMLKKAVLTRDS